MSFEVEQSGPLRTGKLETWSEASELAEAWVVERPAHAAFIFEKAKRGYLLIAVARAEPPEP